MMRAVPVLPVDKPLGLTSHDVVARARRLLGTRKVGHAGTLDPLAGGVLLLLAEGATKLSPFLTGADKRYLAWVAFGASTPTLDAEGPVTERAEPGALARLDGETVGAALPPFLALEHQVPPAYSAVKRGGVKGYEAARAGEALDLPPRPAGYRRIELLAFATDPAALPNAFGDGAEGWRPVDLATPGARRFDLPEPLGVFPTALVDLTVRSGTYVRAFARDLGAALGVPAHLAGLVRTRAGEVGLERCTSLDALAEARGIPESDALPLPRIELDAEQAARVRQGQRLALAFEGRVQLIDPAGRLAAVADAGPRGMDLKRVWHPPPDRDTDD